MEERRRQAPLLLLLYFQEGGNCCWTKKHGKNRFLFSCCLCTEIPRKTEVSSAVRLNKGICRNKNITPLTKQIHKSLQKNAQTSEAMRKKGICWEDFLPPPLLSLPHSLPSRLANSNSSPPAEYKRGEWDFLTFSPPFFVWKGEGKRGGKK